MKITVYVKEFEHSKESVFEWNNLNRDWSEEVPFLHPDTKSRAEELDEYLHKKLPGGSTCLGSAKLYSGSFGVSFFGVELYYDQGGSLFKLSARAQVIV